MAETLLAVDIGLRAGLALFGEDGRLRWYRSSNFGSLARLRRGVAGILDGEPGLTRLVLEGGGPIAEVWEREALKRQLRCQRLSAEDWREKLLLPREQRSGSAAKHHAGRLAREIIAAAGLPRPTSLRHDAAEAILTGWFVISQRPGSHERFLA